MPDEGDEEKPNVDLSDPHSSEGTCLEEVIFPLGSIAKPED